MTVNKIAKIILKKYQKNKKATKKRKRKKIPTSTDKIHKNVKNFVGIT